MMKKFLFIYTNRTRYVYEFPSWKEAVHFAANEGDHLLEWVELNERQK